MKWKPYQIAAFKNLTYRCLLMMYWTIFYGKIILCPTLSGLVYLFKIYLCVHLMDDSKIN